jgi:hypothetical protein
MESELEFQPPCHIQGQMLRLSEHHAVAIYLRDGDMWVADFIDGQGVLVDANTWFRFGCGTNANSHALRRMALESAIPIPFELSERIEALHRTTIIQRRQILSDLVKTFIMNVRRSRLTTLLAIQFRHRSSRQAPLNDAELIQSQNRKAEN